MAPNICSWNLTILLCVRLGHFVTVKTWEQLVAVSGLLYEAMGMTPSDLSHTETHISKCRQISHAFFSPPFLSACFPSPPLPSPPLHPPELLFLCLISLVTGNVSIGLFPKLFLMEDKQRTHVSLGDVGLPEVSRFFLTVFFMLEGGRMGEMRQETLARRPASHEKGRGMRPAGV